MGVCGKRWWWVWEWEGGGDALQVVELVGAVVVDGGGRGMEEML